ncbi:MAG: hypothetical protein ABIB43_06610 [archaeon]
MKKSNKPEISNKYYKTMFAASMSLFMAFVATHSYKMQQENNYIRTLIVENVSDYDSEKYSEFIVDLEKNMNTNKVIQAGKNILLEYRKEFIKPIEYNGPVFVNANPDLPSEVMKIDSIYQIIDDLDPFR